jgi:hypothetical protein
MNDEKKLKTSNRRLALGLVAFALLLAGTVMLFLYYKNPIQ